MPKAKRGRSGTRAEIKDLGRVIAATSALAEEEDDDDLHDASHYSGGFGTRRGTVCHCSRCLRRSGPLTDDPKQVVDDIAEVLQDIDPEGPSTGFNVPPEELEEQHRVLAGALTLAVERGDSEVLRTLLNGIEDYSMQVEVATRLVVPAAQHGHANLIYLLDTFEADLEEPDSARGGPPLMHAANNGHVAVIHALLELGAYTESVDFQKQTALMVAVFSDRASSVEALLSCGACVDAEDCRGRTALSHAARYGSLDCIAVLAAHNADVFHEDKDGRTPLEIAEECARFEAAAQLKRFEQRQRLRERKELRQKDTTPAPKLDRQELMQREAEALLHALALVEEEEAEAARKMARKQKKKERQKKKGKAVVGPVGKDREEADAESDSEAACSKPPPQPPVPKATEKARDESPSSCTEPSLQAAGGEPSQQARSEEAAAAADPLAGQRAAWDTLLEEAATCRDEARQAALVEEVRTMAEQCSSVGISVKYGKKVLGKLERAAAVRQALRTVEGLEELEAAVTQGRGLRSLLDPDLLAHAEAKLEFAMAQKAERERAQQQQRQQQQRRREQEAEQEAERRRQQAAQQAVQEAEQQAARKAEQEARRKAEQQVAEAEQRRRQLQPQWEAAKEAEARLHRLHAEHRQEPRKEANPATAQPPPPPYSALRANGVNGNARLPHPEPAVPHSNGHLNSHVQQRVPPPPPPARAQPDFRDLFPLPAAGAQMHDQGLANIWQQQPPPQPPPATSNGGFFSGSLFEAALPLQRPPPSPARQPQMSTWHPFSGPEPVAGANLGWLDSMLGPKHTSSALTGLPSSFPAVPVSTSTGRVEHARPMPAVSKLPAVSVDWSAPALFNGQQRQPGPIQLAPSTAVAEPWFEPR